MLKNKMMVLPILLLFTMTSCGPAIVTMQSASEPTDSPTEALPLPTSSPAPVPTDTAAPLTASISFANDVMPIFESRCIKCHGGEQTKEGLDLKTYPGLVAGSQNGSVITPGNADDSYLVQQLLKARCRSAVPD